MRDLALDSVPCVWSLVTAEAHRNLSEALVQHGHQELCQDDNHHYVVGAHDEGTNERAELLGVTDPRDKQDHVRQRKHVPEQGIARAHEPETERGQRYSSSVL